jgi:N-acetylglucosamine-6-phosphate deacetylase
LAGDLWACWRGWTGDLWECWPGLAGELLITAPRVVPGTGEPAILEPGYVLVTDGRVAEVGGGTPPRRPDLALGSGYLVPGLIDLQVNGYFGVSLADVEPAGWALVARRLPETGTTGFLPTFAAAPGRICLVTDASAAAGMAPGRYRLGGKLVEVRPGDGQAPQLADGTLAGSVLRMDRAVANAVAAGVGLAEAVAAATRIPADLLGRPDLGRLNPGAAADLVWLDDDLRAQATWVAGEPVYPTGAVPA